MNPSSCGWFHGLLGLIYSCGQKKSAAWSTKMASRIFCSEMTLSETNQIAPENRPGPKRDGQIFQPSTFRGETAVSFMEGAHDIRMSTFIQGVHRHVAERPGSSLPVILAMPCIGNSPQVSGEYPPLSQPLPRLKWGDFMSHLL